MEKLPKTENSFEIKKRKFFSNFALRHRNELKLHKEFGVLAKHEGWRNVSEHCLVEAVAADTLAREIRLSDEDRSKLVTAAFLHDFYKKKEIEALEQGGREAFDQSHERGLEAMRKHGLSEEIIKISNSVGHTALKRMCEPDVTLLEKLMCYIDDITLGSDIVPLDKRLDVIEASPRERKLAESLRATFNGKAYYEVQREVGHEIEKELAERFGLDDPKELPNLLKEKINERIEKGE